jgi:hypothetical protein
MAGIEGHWLKKPSFNLRIPRGPRQLRAGMKQEAEEVFIVGGTGKREDGTGGASG